MTMEALGQSDLDHDFNIFNAAKEIWNGTDFVTEAVADFEDYRVEATKQGDANSPDVDAWFTASIPAGAVAEATSYLMRVRGATLADSHVVAGPAAIGDGDAAAVAAAAAAVAVSQTTASAVRSAVGLESANLAHLVNAVVGKNTVTPVSDTVFDIAIRNAADDATLVTIRYNTETGAKSIVT